MRRKMQILTGWLLFVAVALVGATIVEAKITRIEITSVQSPTFIDPQTSDGLEFGSVGKYEKLKGRAYGEVDPADPRNAIIVDIELAPRNARGMVEYATDVMILKPIDLSKGNHRIFFDVNNRGGIRFRTLIDGTANNDPSSAADAGNGFLMRQGYTIVLSGWDATVSPGGGVFTISVPVAKNLDGSSIVGKSLEEFVIDNATTLTQELTYRAVSLDTSQASLSVRNRYSDTPTPISPDKWRFDNDLTVRLLPAGTPFANGSLYELDYQAKDPIVAGLGFAGLRDLISFLRHATAADHNPLAGYVQRVYSFGSSQPTRFLHDFLALGFNEDETGAIVFDGMLNWIGGASGGFFNYRLAQPGITHRQHIGRWFPEAQFPFTYAVTFDPVTSKTDGWLRRCLATQTCPKVFEINSENEYWAKGGSRLNTDSRGQDLRDPAEVRFYLLSSFPHGAATGLGNCQKLRNPLAPNRPLRALLVALDAWVSSNAVPPPSEIPRRAAGTLVDPLPQKRVGFPVIPGVTYNGVLHTGDLFDFGPSFEDGILTMQPPILLGTPYPVYVPKTDRDGNAVAGIRTPDVEVPIATYTGWALRAGPAAGDGCDGSGQIIPFALTRAERLASGDPRKSIEERFASHADYVQRVTNAALLLQRRGLLLGEDVQRYIDEATASSIGN